MDTSEDALDNLVLELSLASSMPVGVEGRNFVQATSSANALHVVSELMEPRELKYLDQSIGPLLTLLWTDIDDPVAAKAALALRSLMPSRVCMKRLMDLEGIEIISKLFQQLLQSAGDKKLDMKVPSNRRTLLEHCAAVYREIGRFYPWKIVHAGVLPYLVIILKQGDIPLKTIAAGILAVLSLELEICKLMFTTGCIKPLLDVADGDVTNEACMLAAVGSIVQLCRIPEIGIRVFRQGALPVLEKSLLRDSGLCIELIREKGLYALSWLSRIPEVKPKMVTDKVLFGLKREVEVGTVPSQFTVMQMLLNLHNCYRQEKELLLSLVDEMLRILKTAPWPSRNLCCKCLCVLYREERFKLYFAESGGIDSILDIITEKSQDIQEAPLVALLSLASHPSVPKMLFEREVERILGELLHCPDDIVRDLAVVFLKALALYNKDAVDASIPEFKGHLMEVKTDNIEKYGFEYGGMIQEYLQQIVENRREGHYLLEKVPKSELEELGFSKKELRGFEDTFMELDPNCSGRLDILGLKVLMTTIGEDLEDEELQELLDEYGKKDNNTLDFMEFLVMLRDWKTRFGTGFEKIVSTATKRGHVARARRKAKHVVHTYVTRGAERDAVAVAKDKRQGEADERQELAATHWEAERIRLQREKEIKLRAARANGRFK